MIGFWADFFTFLQVAIGLFLIFIIMLQRGKGGGLVGALGGMGGASAFGPKADIQVLKLTIGLAIAWVVIACVGIFFNRAYHVANPTVDDTATEVKSTDKAAKDKTVADKTVADKTGADKTDADKKGTNETGTDKTGADKLKTPVSDKVTPEDKSGGKAPAIKVAPETPVAKPAEKPAKTTASEKPADKPATKE